MTLIHPFRFHVSLRGSLRVLRETKLYTGIYRACENLRRSETEHGAKWNNLRETHLTYRASETSVCSVSPKNLRAPLRILCGKMAIPALLLFTTSAFTQIPKDFRPGSPIPLGHSHNDYLQQRPLWDALENGFTSIEIDLYTASDSSLRVSHLPFSLNAKPTLDALYLRPLKQWIDQNHGRVYPDTDLVLTLMIDLKGNGAITYPLLKQALLPYRDYITRYEQRALYPGPLRILLSGNRPVELLAADAEQWFSLDAPLGNTYVGQNVRVDRESAPYAAHFKKRGNGSLSEAEHEKLRNFVKQTTDNGHELRFWAAGNNPKRWETLANAGVSTLNADKLLQFREWVLEYIKNKK